ncbi:MAG TPA: carboxypeptidase-like regulatory domain-containing protein [Kofleriaceae bacterium]|nr:carboxypeptidase-like regulatory domain-containing protein [Kofleriaceae bacterium]
MKRALSYALLLAAGCGQGVHSKPGSDANGADAADGPPGGFTVSGQVVGIDGQPVVGDSVAVLGAPGVLSDANGRFTITGVSPPYDLGVADSHSTSAILYRGLTRPDPLVVFAPLTGPSYTATISGTVTGGTFGANDCVAVRFESPDGVSPTSSDSSGIVPVCADSGGAYTVTVTWHGPSVTSGTLRALWLRDYSPTSVPDGYGGYGSIPLTLSAGATLTGKNVALAAVSTANISGTMTAAAGFVPTLRSLRIQFADGEPGLWYMIRDSNTSGLGASFDYVVPVIAGATFVMVGGATSAADDVSTRVLPALAPGTGIDVSVPAIAEASAPADNATGVTGATPFSWSAGPAQSVYVASFGAAAGFPAYTVITTQLGTTLGDFAQLAMPLPSGTMYGWQVSEVAPFQSMDDYASASGLAWQDYADYSLPSATSYPTTPYSVSLPDGRSFYTQ